MRYIWSCSVFLVAENVRRVQNTTKDGKQTKDRFNALSEWINKVLPKQNAESNVEAMQRNAS